jgi:hypothetical protein
MKRALSLLMIVAAVATLLALSAQAGIKYVDVSKALGGQTGADWANAYTNVDPALAASSSGDSIYVAEGVYVPATNFSMRTGVALYGGFPAGGSALADRNWSTKVTTLSGDVNRDDAAQFANRTDNRATVVRANAMGPATLDGFKIRGATNQGINIAASILIVSNCWITDNKAAGAATVSGAGVNFASSSTGEFYNCIISTNYAAYYGGAIGAAVTGPQKIVLVGCTIYGNVGTGRGGGTYFADVTGTGVRMTNTVTWGNLMGGARMNIFLRGVTTIYSDYCHYTCDNSGSSSLYQTGGAGIGAHDVRDGSSPLLKADVEGGNGDLHLSAWSPCKTAGLAGMSPPKDYDLVTRGSPPAVGAFEYVAYDVDTTPPADVTGAGVTAGHKFLTLSWSNPGDADFSGVVVLRTSSNAPTGVPNPPTGAPQEGVSYALNATIGNAKVAYVGNGTSFTDTGLLISSNYFYKIWTYDTLKNYSDAPVQVDGIPVADLVAPYPVTDVVATPLSDTSVQLDWVNSSSSDALGVIILRRIGAASTDVPVNTNIYAVGNTIGDSVVVYTNASGATTWTDTGLLFGDTAHHYSIFAFDVAPNYSDRTDGSAVTDVDPTAPGNVTAQTATGDDASVVLNWTNPADTDVRGVLILRSTAGTPTGTPDVGTTYTAGQTIGDGTVVFVGGSTTPSGAGSWSDDGRDNGTHYYYKIFACDERPNYASGGVAADATPAAPASVKYVKWDAGGDNNGTSWTHAYINLTNALFNAAGGDELRVAKGTYTPAVANGLKSSRFNMKTNVKLYGGFVGTETYRYQRNWSNNVTVLSGDLNGDDTANWGGRTENVTNVVWASGGLTGVVLDGFTVKGGYADNATVNNGGGFHGGGSGLGFRIANCVFTDNRIGTGSYGAGIGFDNSSGATGTIENCLIYGNYSGYRGGGFGVDGYNVPLSSITLQNCTIVTNFSVGEGAGVYIRALAATKTVIMRNCIIWGNYGTSTQDLRNRTSVLDEINNCDYGTTSGTFVYTGVNKQLDPLFVNPNGNNFRLTAESPCKDAATSSGAPAKDLDCVVRPQGASCDIGAYEFVVSSGADITPPAEVSNVGIVAGHQFLSPSWTNPGDADFAGVLVVRKLGSAPTGTPTDGAAYIVGQGCGDGMVAYVNSGTGFTDSGLVNGSTYYYKFFTYDALMNYSDGVGADSSPVPDTTAPDPVTSLTVAAQSDSSIKLDWVNSASADAVGVTILRKTGGAPTGTPSASTTYTVGTVISDGTVVYVGTGSTWTDTSLTQELTTYGYSVFARDIVPNYSTRADGSDVTLTDSTIPGNVTAQTATPDDGAVELAWTHPSDTDVAGVLILRSAAGTPGGTPAAGTDYTVGQSIGDGTVVYVSGSATPGGAGAWSDQGLDNGTHYYYKIFAFDEHPNYASGGAAADATPAGPGSVKYVNGAMGAEGNGSTWATAFKTLTNALFNATSGDELWVATGTYKPDAAGGLKSSRFNLTSGVKVYGGFTSGMSHRYERSWTNHVTTLSGDLDGNDTASWGNRGDNVTNVLYANLVTGVVVDGFTVRGGYSTADTAYGAGMFANAATVTVANCVFIDNLVGGGGGGIYLTAVNATIERTRFVSNASVTGGGGLFANGPATSPPTGVIRNCVFTGNRCEGAGNNDGGGLYVHNSVYNIESCTVYSNYTERRGGGIKVGAQSCTTAYVIKNCIIWGNSTGYNLPAEQNGGWQVAAQKESSATMTLAMINCDWSSGSSQIYTYLVTPAYTAMTEGDPLFVNAAAGDFRLLSGSAAIDAGTSSGAPVTDINGDTRPAGNGIDIGAYENTVYTVTVTPTAGATVTFNGQTYSASTVVPVEAGSYTASYTSPQAEGTTTQYVFSAWTLDGSAAGSSPATIVVGSANRVLNVTFTKQFKLALALVGGAYGSVTGGSNGAWYDDGTLLELDAQPLPRATFVGWTGCVGGLVTMDGAKSVTATFDSTDPTFIMFQ